jgi:hypothetical protein
MKQTKKTKTMKTLTENIAANIAIYGFLILLLTGLAYGAELFSENVTDEKSEEQVFVFEEEEYIDDIPFDTEAIAEAYNYENSLKVEYEFNDEAYVDDIPFDTYKVAYDDNPTYASVK